MVKKLIFIILVFAGIILQSSQWYSKIFQINDVKIEFVLLFALLLSIRFGLYYSYLIGFFAGFFIDLISVGHMGVYTLSYFAACTFAGFFHKKIMFKKMIIVFFIIFFGLLFYSILQFLEIIIIHNPSMAFFYLTNVILLGIIFNSILFIPFYYFIKSVDNIIQPHKI